ncbi:MAG TPA: hypothetical protein VFS05_09575 [Gemmatimonadaceae bacterium]|nr:hypothetical protein [Gemmatimonadaceae bacterium]
MRAADVPSAGRHGSSRRRLVIAAALLLAACSRKEVAGPEFEAFDFSFSDAAADTLPHDGTAPGGALDVVSVSGSVDDINLQLVLTFAAPVAFWSAAQPNSIDGFLDLDLDENATTGIPAAVNEYGGSASIGAEYYLSLRDVQPGRIALVSPTSEPVTYRLVSATVSGNTMHVIIPRTMLSDPDGAFRLAAVVGNPARPATDFAPSEGYYAVRRP